MRYNLRSLQIIEAVFRHGSLSLAADELSITKSAVSHQLRKLSDDIGETLLVRQGKGVALTAAGHRLASALHEAFDQIERSIADSVGQSRTVLRLAVCSSFGPGWLIKRLAAFGTDHPEINLQLRMYAEFPQLTDAVADAFVTAYPLEHGFISTPLFDEKLVAVHAVGMPLHGHPLITTNIEEKDFAGDWQKYCETGNIELEQIGAGNLIQCSHYILALEMARQGLGTALVPDFLAADDVEAGRLVRASDHVLPSERRYYFCFKKARRSDPNLQSLGAWLKRNTVPSG